MATGYLKYPSHRKVDKLELIRKRFNVGDRVVVMVDIVDSEFGMPYAKVGDVLRVLDVNEAGKLNRIAVCHELGMVKYNIPVPTPKDLHEKSLEDLAFYVNEREVIKSVTNPYMDRFPLKGKRYVDPAWHK